MTVARRMTPDQLAAAAASLAVAMSGNGLPPMPTAAVLDVLAQEARLRLADLWTLRDSIDAELDGAAHSAAVASVAAMGLGYSCALDAARSLAAVMGHALPTDASGPPW